MGAPVNRTIGAFPQPVGPQVEVVQAPNGRLVCSEHRDDLACIHIGKVIRYAWDAHDGPDKREPLPPEFALVVWPKPFLEVWVGHDQESGAVWILKDQDANDISGTIGFIEPGEGRKVVRTMIVEWIAAEHSRPPACGSQFHWNNDFTSAAEAKRAADPYDPKTQADLFNLITKGICATCAADVGVPEL